MVVTGVTSSGFEYSVNSGITRDFEFVKAMRKTQDSSLSDFERFDNVCYMIECIFHDEKEEERFYSFLADKSENKRADIDTVVREANEIIEAIAAKDKTAKK